MPTFVLLQRVEDYAASGMLWSGAEGASAQRKAIRAIGGRVLAQYAVLGQYDVVLVVDLPDYETALAVGLNAQEGGFYTEVLPAFSPEDMRSAADKVRVAAARKPRSTPNKSRRKDKS